MRFQKFALVAALAMPLVSSADAPSPTKITVSDTGLQVLADVHQSDMLEVKAGKLALDNASTQGVKSFAKMLVDEHGADARMILSMVDKLHLVMPAGAAIDRADVATLARLDQLHGQQFDVEFLRAQIAMHDKTLAKLDLQIAQVKDDPDLASMLRNLRPVIVKHKQQAQTLLGAIVGNENQRR